MFYVWIFFEPYWHNSPDLCLKITSLALFLIYRPAAGLVALSCALSGLLPAVTYINFLNGKYPAAGKASHAASEN
ncbi:hypothetical protein DC498_03300 [Terrimonas sp.]|nr:hypothetical protein DC498_03300 [Terrimonas sp.]